MEERSTEVLAVVSETPDILIADRMKRRYGGFYDRSPKVHLDPRNVPEQFWPLLPYAEFWGIADDWTREGLVDQAVPDVRRNLKDTVSLFEDALEEWLIGAEARNRDPSDEYVAFAAMIMAADYV